MRNKYTVHGDRGYRDLAAPCPVTEHRNKGAHDPRPGERGILGPVTVALYKHHFFFVLFHCFTFV